MLSSSPWLSQNAQLLEAVNGLDAPRIVVGDTPTVPIDAETERLVIVRPHLAGFGAHFRDDDLASDVGRERRMVNADDLAPLPGLNVPSTGPPSLEMTVLQLGIEGSGGAGSSFPWGRSSSPSCFRSGLTARAFGSSSLAFDFKAATWPAEIFA